MNISLEKTEEFVNGRLRRAYGEAFIRGNNGNLLQARPAFIILTRATSHVHFRSLEGVSVVGTGLLCRQKQCSF